MPAITPVDASMAQSAKASMSQVQFGEAVTRGDVAYYNSTTGKYHKARANASGTYKAAGIVMTDVAADQQGLLLVKDFDGLSIGGTQTTGLLCAVAPAVAGGIVDAATPVTGEFLFVFGVVIPGNKLRVDFINPIYLDAAIP